MTVGVQWLEFLSNWLACDGYGATKSYLSLGDGTPPLALAIPFESLLLREAPKFASPLLLSRTM